MTGETRCAVCGNDIEPAAVSCPYCGTARTAEYDNRNTEQVRVVNLERGMPRVPDALSRFALELEAASRAHLKALVLIHGYGSSGSGGAIRKALRQKLQMDLERGNVSEVLPGEEAGRRSGPTRQAMKRFPDLRRFLDRANPGITVVIL